ncbi:NifB/NifX family molybdenum-iron cluster-binding protein [Planctomycetota bacterium]
MKIAIPTAEGKLCMHFGHCQVFTIADVDEESKKISSMVEETPPPHEPGVLPKWLNELGVNTIIAGGMGMRAQQFFTEYGVEVLVGAPAETPEEIVNRFLQGSLETGENVCDH